MKRFGDIFKRFVRKISHFGLYLSVRNEKGTMQVALDYKALSFIRRSKFVSRKIQDESYIWENTVVVTKFSVSAKMAAPRRMQKFGCFWWLFCLFSYLSNGPEPSHKNCKSGPLLHSGISLSTLILKFPKLLHSLCKRLSWTTC